MYIEIYVYPWPIHAGKLYATLTVDNVSIVRDS